MSLQALLDIVVTPSTPVRQANGATPPAPVLAATGVAVAGPAVAAAPAEVVHATGTRSRNAAPHPEARAGHATEEPTAADRAAADVVAHPAVEDDEELGEAPVSVRHRVLVGIAVVALSALGLGAAVSVAGQRSDSASAMSAVTTVVPLSINADQAAAPAAPPATPAAAATVANVTTGDTLAMSDGSVVRLVGVDAPATGACADQAVLALSALLLSGGEITVTPTGAADVDASGRLLRYVEVGGQDVAVGLIERGLAQPWSAGAHPREDAYAAALTNAAQACTAG